MVAKSAPLTLVDRGARHDLDRWIQIERLGEAFGEVVVGAVLQAATHGGASSESGGAATMWLGWACQWHGERAHGAVNSAGGFTAAAGGQRRQREWRGGAAVAALRQLPHLPGKLGWGFSSVVTRWRGRSAAARAPGRSYGGGALGHREAATALLGFEVGHGAQGKALYRPRPRGPKEEDAIGAWDQGVSGYERGW